MLDLYNIDTLSHLKCLPSYETRSRLSKLPNLQDFDIDENFIRTINSSYFSSSELSKLSKARKDFSLFHMNLRSLSLHYDELCSLPVELKLPFDITDITETKEQWGKGFQTNVNLCYYDVYSQTSKTSAGGSAIFVRSNLSHWLRPAPSALEEGFETVWVEIENNKSKNILSCCAYIHPNTDTNKSVNSLENIFAKLDANKEDKLMFMLGDFSINLLNYKSPFDTNIFLNSMVSKCLLLYILHPTRVTDHSATVIDNIFSNNFEYETVSGNIITQTADHFPQFMHLKKIHVDYKLCSYGHYDYSYFSEQHFQTRFC